MTDACNASNITATVAAYAVEKGIDITIESGWSRAFNECKAVNPTAFAR